MARALGGPDDEANLVTACFECNIGKGINRLSAVSRESSIHRVTAMAVLQTELPQAAPTVRQLADLEVMAFADGARVLRWFLREARGYGKSDNDALRRALQLATRCARKEAEKARRRYLRAVRRIRDEGIATVTMAGDGTYDIRWPWQSAEATV